jgi:hypothetical protein
MKKISVLLVVLICLIATAAIAADKCIDNLGVRR